MKPPPLLPLHSAGWPFIGACTLVTLLLLSFSHALGLLSLVVTVWCVLFFRNPPRVSPEGKDLILSPADGILVGIESAVPPKEVDWGTTPLTKLSIFLSVFDVHVTRSPFEGTIKKIVYHPGKFLSASLDKASEANERNSLVIQNPSGKEVLVVQIAGLIARRIVCEVSEDQDIKAGEGFGIIRFGSRVDIYLPKEAIPQVLEGQRMVGGETVLATFSSSRTSKAK